MSWLNKSTIELFNNIPQEILENLVLEKQNSQEHFNLSKVELINHLMGEHILNKNKLPLFVTNTEDLVRWLFCLYIIS